MTYNPFHELPNTTETIAKITAIIRSLADNGWQGSPLVAIGNQLYNGCHRLAACEMLGIEPVVHTATITLDWGDDDDWLLEDLDVACSTAGVLHVLEEMLPMGYIDGESVRILREECEKKN